LAFFKNKTKQGRIFLRESLQICKCLVLVQQKKKIVRVTSLGIFEPAASRLFSFFRFSSNKTATQHVIRYPRRKQLTTFPQRLNKEVGLFFVIFIFPLDGLFRCLLFALWP